MCSLFSRTFSKGKGKFYGTGVYIAKHAIYPQNMNLCHRPISNAKPSIFGFVSSNEKQLILANVVLGNMMDYGNQILQERKAIEPNGYHSLSGTEGDMQFLKPHQGMPQYRALFEQGSKYGRQYVVHRSNQTYPAYLVTYKT